MHFNYNYPVGGGFDRLPRTAREAVAQNWVGDSVNCTNGGKFNGYRYTDYTDPGAEFVALLYDVQGVIAGLQIYLPQNELLFNKELEIEKIPMYQKAKMDGRDYFVVTTYFVDPAIICDGGRPESELQSVGTGTDVYYQNGPSPNHLHHLPHRREEAIAGDYGNNGCIRYMGFHCYYRLHHWEKEKCSRIPPAFGIYNNDGRLHAYGFTIPVEVSSPKYEHPTPAMLLHATEGPDKFPQCLYDISANYGITTLHIYMLDEPWKLQCPA
jgi:hypothetical protein